MSKSVQTFLLFPPILFYIIIKRKAGIIFKQIHLYTAFLSAILIIVSYYYFREQMNTGYFQAVLKNEAGRFFNTQEGHSGNSMFYFNGMITERFFPWIFFFIFSFYLFIKQKFYPDQKNLLVYCLYISMGYLLIISFSKTKLEWYDLPAYPFMALFIGGVMYKTALEYFHKIKPVLKIITISGLLLSFLLTYTYLLIKITYQIKNDLPYGNALKNEVMANKYIVVNDFFQNGICQHSHLYFYTLLMKEKGFDIKIKQSSELTKGDTVLICEKEIFEKVKAKYSVEIIKKSGSSQWLNIVEKYNY